MMLHSFLLFLSVAIASPLLAADDPAKRDQIRQRVEQIRSGSGLEIEGRRVSSVLVLPALYERREFASVWTNQDSIKQLFNSLEHIHEDGLNSADYHHDKLRELQTRLESGQRKDTSLRAEYDILLTDSLIRLGYHLLIGKVDPVELDSHWNMDRTIGDLEMILDMAKAIDTGTVAELVEDLRPTWPTYARFKAALARYRQIEQHGGWPSVPDGPVLKPGMSNPRVAAIRRRLAVTDELSTTDLDSPLYDEAIEEAVKQFQRHHNLAADGVVGPATLAAMNVPVEDRTDQIRVNLERARWVMHNLPDEFVLTDIAGFQVSYFRDGDVIWHARAQVGRPYRKTPVFKSRITYLEINPTWTIPPGILRNDILPRLKKDPGYLQRKDMRVLRHNGEPVDASTIDWSQYPARRFPYMIRQNPGPRNALGQIKFMFPNKHLVYLHDTPSRSLFDRPQRTFSSGCIRIEHPFEFAELLLKSDRWTRQRVEEIVASEKITRVNLPTPVAVILLYWTFNVDEDGNIQFKKDIYDRDDAVLAGLSQPFRFRSSPILDP